MARKKEWCVRVTSDGRDMYLRVGPTAGVGRVAMFDKGTAEINAEMLKPGLNRGDIVAIVRRESVPQEELQVS